VYTNEILQRCAGCLSPLEGLSACSACGLPVQFEQAAPYLPLRAMLAQGRFGVGRAVDQNGDGITYLAFDEQARAFVYIREFYPAAIAIREQGQLAQIVMQGCEAVWQDCAQNFMELWRKLQHMRGLSALLSVTDVFEENGTIYAVYEYMESMTFRDFLLRGKQGFIPWERARALLMPVLSTLGNLHQQGIIHRGISPTTLFFGADGKVRIGGFSIWQARTAHGDLTAELLDGYAALEQYGLEDKQGAWTDIYAFAAVLYRSLIGSNPDDAVSRRHNDRVMVPAHFAERIPPYVINALVNAMQVFPEERTRTVEQFRAELSASPTAVARAAQLPPALTRPAGTTPSANPKDLKKKQRNQSAGVIVFKTAGIILLTGIVITVIYVGLFQRDKLRDAIEGVRSRPEISTVAQPSGIPVEVKRYTGLLYNKELQEDLERNFQVTIVSVPSDEAPDVIVRQVPEAGNTVPLGSELLLEISAGRPAELPGNLEGRDIKDVRAQLEELGFVVSVNEIKNEGGNPAGTVIKLVSPAPDRQYHHGTKIFLTVWGSEPTAEPATQPADAQPSEQPQEEIPEQPEN